MPFYQATGRDMDTLEPKSLQISARSDHEAIDTAATNGLTQIKLHPYSDRDVLMMDFQCFLNADTKTQTLHRPQRIRARATEPSHAKKTEQVASDVRSLLLRHPIPTIAIAVLLAIWIDRGLTTLIAMI
jgi:hypothetical protein